MKENKFDKQKLLSTVVTVILIIFFIGGFGIGLDRVRSMEGTFPPNDIKEGLTEAPETVEEAIEFLSDVLDKAGRANVKIDYSDSFSVDSDSIETDGSEQFRSSLLFAKDKFVDYISSVEDTEDKVTSVDFSAGIKERMRLMRIPSLDSSVVKEVTCNYIYYSCPSCGETSDEPLSSCEPCGSEREYFKKYRNEYEITLVLDSNLNATDVDLFNDAFIPRTNTEAYALTKDVISDIAEITKTDITYNDFRIFFKVNRLTDEITFLRFEKGMDINADVSFMGEYSEVGNKNISFLLKEKNDYSFTWPSLTLNNEELVIEPGDSDNLLATLTCEDPLAMTVTWTSSDESVATVDSAGYISTTKNTGEVEITATFTYLGKTYSDSCKVLVRVPVESMKMSAKSLKLAVGEEATLSTKVSPAKATVQTVTWYSEDESIAAVDENGVVTAKAAGVAVVYALSDDGYYRSTCEVTVE